MSQLLGESVSSLILVATGCILFYLQRQARGKQAALLEQADGLMRQREEVLRRKPKRYGGVGGGISGTGSFGDQGGFRGARGGSLAGDMGMQLGVGGGSGLIRSSGLQTSGMRHRGIRRGDSMRSSVQGRNFSAGDGSSGRISRGEAAGLSLGASDGVTGTISMTQKPREKARRIYTGRRRRRGRRRNAPAETEAGAGE